MTKIDMDNKQQNWKTWAKFFKQFNCDVAPLSPGEFINMETNLFETLLGS